MSLWTRIVDAVSGRAAPAAADTSGLVTRLLPWTVPPRRGSAELLRLYRSQPWLRATAGKTGEACASVKVRLYKVGKGGDRQEVTKHPALDLLARPYPGLTARALRKVTQVHYDLNGDALWVKERARNKQPVQLIPIPPHWIRSFPSQTSDAYQISWRGVTKSIPQSEVVRFQDPDPDEPFGRGTGIGESLADEVDTDEFAAKYTKSWFANFGAPAVLVSVEGATDKALLAVEASWKGNYQGNGKQHQPMFTGGKIRAERLDTSFKDSNLVGVRDQMRDIIVSTWGVPPEILGILTNSNRATIEGADYIMARFVVTPRMDVFVDALNHHLLPDFGDDSLIFGYDNPIPEDKQFALEVATARPQAFTDNEIRKLAGQPAAEGKDEFPEPVAFSAPQLAADPEWTRALPGKPRGKRNVTTDADITRVLEALRPERLTAETDPVMAARIEEWAKSALDDLGAEAKFDLLNPLLPKFLEEQSTTRIKGMVDGTTRDQLRYQLAEGVRAGESIDELELRVDGTFDVATDARAENIARTETLRASNWATHEAQKVSGVVATRKWVATPDGRTRPEHAALNGVEVGIDEAFTIDGHTAMYPGGFGIPEEDCNCRCTTVAVISDDLEDVPEEESFRAVKSDASSADLLTVWRAYDVALGPWDDAMKAALRRGFRAQRDDVVKALRGSS